MKTDQIVWSKELLSAPDVEQLLERKLVDTGDAQWPRAAPIPVSSEPVILEFETPEDGWGDADQFVVPLFVPADAQPFAQLRIDCTSHTPGLQGNDYMRCYYRYLHSGWGRLEFPYENFLIFGIPDQWRRANRVQLALSGAGTGEFLLAGASIEKRTRVEGPRTTDAEIFAALDLDQPALAGVRVLVEQDRLDDAKLALLAYYRARTHPRHPFATRPAPRPDYDRSEADRICDHYILDQQLDAALDWRANPIGYLEWMHAFNRHFFMRTLVDAYVATGDEKYARELDYLLTTWLRTSPVPIGNNGGGDPAWETLSAACRISVRTQTWPALWYALQESPAFQPDTRIDMLKSFYEHAEHLAQYPTRNNWLVAESAAVAMVGMLFPEFKQAEAWRRRGLARLEAEMERQVYPDGAQFELSPGYHRMCADLFANVYALAAPNAYPISRRFADRLQAMFEYTLCVTRPDGTRPSLNDAGVLDLSSSPELLRGHNLFGRKDFLYVATAGQEGEIPSALSRAFPDAGHYVMRTGWSEDALWAIVDAGPFGTGHQHEDKLNLELYAHGTRFIVDPGIASYLDDPWTHYFRSTAAHNTVLVDGQGQNRRGALKPEQHHVDTSTTLWGSSDRLDYVWGTYTDGYEGVEAGLHHSRLVLFVKPRFWVIWDVLTGEGEHSMDVLYHFSPMLVQHNADGDVVRTNRLGLPNLELLPVGKPDAVEIICGQQEPVQGWLAQGGSILPASTAVYRRTGSAPLDFGVVAAPFRSGVSSGLAVQPLEVTPAGDQAPGLAATIVDPAGGRTEIIFTAGIQALTYGGVSTQAQGICIQRTPEGQITYAAGLNCRRLEIGSATLAASETPKPLVEIGLTV